MQNDFLPITPAEMRERGWKQPDFVYVTGDAYVDHPSFGAAIITRLLESQGFKVVVLSQPDWHSVRDFQKFGRPKYAFLITAGNIDSMVAHYTAAKKLRHDDAYTAGGKHGKRPDRAVNVYTRLAKEAYPDCPVILGGLEASLRRFAHYDYWDDAIRPSALVDSGADLLIYGMGEKQITEIARRLREGEPVGSMHDIRGTMYAVPTKDTPFGGVECPSFENVCASKKEYARSCRLEQDEQDHVRGKLLKQRHGKVMVVQNPPMEPLTTSELDRVYSLPYMRAYHPSYEKLGGVPGIEEVRFSITHNRGCFGACNFCSIAFHQGRYVTSRSKKSLLIEAQRLPKCRTSRAIFMMWAAPPPTSATPAAPCRSSTACARAKNAWRRNHAPICRRTTGNIWTFFGRCGRWMESRKCLSAAVFAMIICFATRTTASSGSWCSTM